MFYNSKRRHTHNGHQSPTKYEELYFNDLKRV
ncbi:hypothetical protein [Vibrio cholerae]